mmetsp:Transcript_63044/g.124613  ORF Transcript_63044/g.124613 Transcript_63044/m.124613 type:complete len:226 (-) Transcript_63044:283-960(-)
MSDKGVSIARGSVPRGQEGVGVAGFALGSRRRGWWGVSGEGKEGFSVTRRCSGRWWPAAGATPIEEVSCVLELSLIEDDTLARSPPQGGLGEAVKTVASEVDPLHAVVGAEHCSERAAARDLDGIVIEPKPLEPGRAAQRVCKHGRADITQRIGSEVKRTQLTAGAHEHARRASAAGSEAAAFQTEIRRAEQSTLVELGALHDAFEPLGPVDDAGKRVAHVICRL